MDLATQEINGFINIDKSVGLSSHDVVAAVRRLLACRVAKRKVGHAGTLDPAATGVLPVGVGKATRLIEYITDCRKSYRATIVFGLATDSYDAEGKVVASCSAEHLSEQDVLAVLPQFRGTIAQIPPMVSALKKRGQPLYKLARSGQEIEREPRAVTIYDLQYLGGSFIGERPNIELDITCSRGTYIRSIAHDLGAILGVGAHLSRLRRTQVGPFKIEKSYTLEEIGDMALAGNLEFILPPAFAIDHLPKVVVSEKQAQRLSQGIAVTDPNFDEGDLAVCRVEEPQGRLVGIARLEEAVLTMNKVLINCRE
ncbi:MAG: tRNA pseudouridine(55) synthase TruB [Bacillota bacterium]|jgi:tRNA pseudouridine55 synthase